MQLYETLYFHHYLYRLHWLHFPKVFSQYFLYLDSEPIDFIDKIHFNGKPLHLNPTFEIRNFYLKLVSSNYHLMRPCESPFARFYF